MKKYLMALLGCLFILTGCSGGLPALEPDHYLYELKDEDGNIAYLLGSASSGNRRLDYDGIFSEVYEKSDSILLEVSYDIDYDASNKAYTSYPLSQFVGDESFDMIWEAIQEHYPTIKDDFLNYNCFYTRDTIYTSLMDAIGLNTMYGIDYSLNTLANQDGKTIYGVKDYITFCEETSFLGNDYPQYILASLVDKNQLLKNMETFTVSYALGTMDEKIARSINVDLANIPEKYQTTTVVEESKLYPNTGYGPNNQEIVEAIGNYMQEETILATIGIDHFYGENNVMDLLKETGYTITKID